MIHTFSISNFYSVHDEVVLDLRIPGTAPNRPEFRRSRATPDIRLPSVVLLIGPNGSGKSTLLSALGATTYIAAHALPTVDPNPLAVFCPFFFYKPKANRRGFAWSLKRIAWAESGSCSAMS